MGNLFEKPNPFEKLKPLTFEEMKRMREGSIKLEIHENERMRAVDDLDKNISSWEGEINAKIIKDDHPEYGKNSNDEK